MSPSASHGQDSAAPMASGALGAGRRARVRRVAVLPADACTPAATHAWQENLASKPTVPARTGQICGCGRVEYSFIAASTRGLGRAPFDVARGLPAGSSWRPRFAAPRGAFSALTANPWTQFCGCMRVCMSGVVSAMAKWGPKTKIGPGGPRWPRPRQRKRMEQRCPERTPAVGRPETSNLAKVSP
jgi:hypothetical protein